MIFKLYDFNKFDPDSYQTYINTPSINSQRRASEWRRNGHRIKAWKKKMREYIPPMLKEQAS